jgi:hypothetical protein
MKCCTAVTGTTPQLCRQQRPARLASRLLWLIVTSKQDVLHAESHSMRNMSTRMRSRYLRYQHSLIHTFRAATPMFQPIQSDFNGSVGARRGALAKGWTPPHAIQKDALGRMVHCTKTRTSTVSCGRSRLRQPPRCCQRRPPGSGRSAAAAASCPCRQRAARGSWGTSRPAPRLHRPSEQVGTVCEEQGACPGGMMQMCTGLPGPTDPCESAWLTAHDAAHAQSCMCT